MSIVWDSLKSAKHDKTSLSAIWLDIASAYGSVPHRLVYFALVSIVLFLAAINVIIEFTLSLQDSFIQEHRLGMKAFMDDH